MLSVKVMHLGEWEIPASGENTVADLLTTSTNSAAIGQHFFVLDQGGSEITQQSQNICPSGISDIIAARSSASMSLISTTSFLREKFLVKKFC